MLPFLRCLLCCEDEVQSQPDLLDVGSLFRRFKRNPNPCFDYHQVPSNYDTFPKTIAPTRSGANSITHLTPQTTTRNQSQNSSISSNFPPKPKPPSLLSQPSFDRHGANSISHLTPQTTTRIQSQNSSISSNFPPKPKIPSVLSQPSNAIAPTSYGTNSITETRTSASTFQDRTKKPDANRTDPKPPIISYSFLDNQSPSEYKPSLVFTKPSSSQSGPPPSSSSSSSSTTLSSPKYPPLSNKPILSRASFNPTTEQAKTNYNWVEKGSTPLYVIPEDIKGLIKRDIVPEVLKKPLSPLTYKDYFASLLYAEDYYLEKWDGFEMKNVTLKLHEAKIYVRKGTYKNRNKNDEKDDKIFVEFEIDSIPEKRPFLLSRDFASVWPSGRKVEPFQGIIYRVVKSTLVLVEFGDDFHAQHNSSCKYDVKFSFNRVCLKRAHQAISAASDVLFTNFLFPDCIPKSGLISKQLLSISHKLDTEQVSAVCRILSLKGSPPHLVEGPLSVSIDKQLSRTGMVVDKQLSRTGMVVQEAVLQLCRTSSVNRILICAPLNSTCDAFMRSVKKELPESDIFRANAAFRELDGVPVDILPFCPYKEECFSCPSLSQLKNFKVILSTFMSTFRLHNEGIRAGHFSHIFLVDASSATEPETLVPLTNLANEMTKVVISGAPGNESRWVRSYIARQNGLKMSYFERLRERKLYRSLKPEFITKLKHVGREADGTYSSPSFY